MLSTDLLFYLCSAVIFVLFYASRSPTLQTLVLSGGSLAMYATEGLTFLLLLLASTGLTAVSSFLIATRNRREATAVLIAGFALNLFVLVAFKYKHLLFPLPPPLYSGLFRQFLELALPIGISFYTFHAISLLVDSWRNPDVLRHRGDFLQHCLDTALYLSFFPQLVAGPITKGKTFFPQIVAKRFSDIPWADALTNIIVGIFLKRVIADNLNLLTLDLTEPRLYGIRPHSELIAYIFGYSAQIFADFAGYSLIAVGVAKLFGYRLPDNFNQPYLAQSITDFWRRWHMSLSAWLRDYLYIPLGGNRLGPVRTYINLLIVMGLGGLWHGADWKFAVWGLWHGVLLAVERLLGIDEPSRGSWFFLALVRIPMTFLLVTFGWLLFRLEHLGDLVLLAEEFGRTWRPLSTAHSSAAVPIIYTLVGVVVLVHLPLQGLLEYNPTKALVSKTRPFALGFLCAVILMASGSRNAFIYFQF